MTVRLEDVARASAVSLATASIALRGDGGRLARKTVNRIREVAAGLGYIPDAAASQLARGSPTGRSGVFWGTLAHLGPDPLFTQSIKDTKARGEPDNLLMVATELGYRLEYFALPSDPRGIAALVRILHSRGISGLVVNFHNEHWTGNFPWHDFKVITLSAQPAELDLSTVKCHSMADTIEAVRICHTLGYRRLGLSVDAELYPHWIAGFELSTARLGIARTGAVLSLTTWDETAFLNWQKENDFDAIIANHGIAPLVAWEKNPPLKSRPGLVALDVGENHPGLSGFHQRRAERDRVAIETLHNLLRRRSGTLLDGPITIEVASVWQPGNTLPGLLG